MKAIIFCLLLISLFNASAQEKPKNNYLIIRIKIERDFSMSRYGCSIIAEGGSDSAKSIYNLKEYNFRKNANNSEHSFYFNSIDTATALYNFFNTPTEALNFMAKNGWTLLFVYSETTSGYEQQEGSESKLFPITTIASSPVYYLKNETFSV